MKFFLSFFNISIDHVAPLVGAWIEISVPVNGKVGAEVAPLVGAWIEMYLSGGHRIHGWSLPSWERGLKSD